MKIKLTTVRAIVRYLPDRTLSNRKIGRMVGVSHNSDARVRLRLALTEKSWDELKELDDKALELAISISPKGPQRKPAPDWAFIHLEMTRPDVTLETLWQEFREREPNGISYTHFTRLYGEWLGTQKTSMRQTHAAGDKMFVDFCGRTMPVTDQLTGVVTNVPVFVAVLGASGMTFAMAVASQNTANWIKCHTKAFDFFGGVPNFVVPDNLKAAVIKNSREQVVFNSVYAEYSEHYGFGILPARPRKPKDKSMAEVSVKIVQRFVLARLRNETFFSLDELNKRIGYWVDQLNTRVTRTYPKSRMERFLEIDLPALQSLPLRAYDYSEWRYSVRVGRDYHVEFRGHYYSVPHQYSNLIIDMRIGDEWLEIVHSQKVVARHKVVRTAGITTLREHLTPDHRHVVENQPESLLSWAEEVGEQTLIFVRKNLEQRKDFANGIRAVVSLRQDTLNGVLPNARLESGCGYANKLNVFSLSKLRSIIANEADLRPKKRKSISIEHSNIRGPEYYAAQGDETL